MSSRYFFKKDSKIRTTGHGLYMRCLTVGVLWFHPRCSGALWRRPAFREMPSLAVFQVLGDIFPLTNRVFWVPGIFDPLSQL